MSQYVTKIRTDQGEKQIDYNALANLPDAANKVENSLVVKLNGGTTEDTNMFTFDGSVEKNINLTPSSMYGIVDGGIASVKEKSTSGTRYAKIADIQCESHYYRICQSVLLTSRTDALILTIVLYSADSNKFIGYDACYTPLTKNCGSIISNLHAGMINVSNDVNRFELWYSQGQYGCSLNITPLARSEENITLNFYSYGATDDCSANAPSFNVSIPINNACE